MRSDFSLNIKCHKEVLYLQPLIQPKRFDIFSPLTGGCSEGLGAFCFFSLNIVAYPFCPGRVPSKINICTSFMAQPFRRLASSSRPFLLLLLLLLLIFRL